MPTPASGARGTSSAATTVGTGITITTAAGKHSQRPMNLPSAGVIVSALFVHSLASLGIWRMIQVRPSAPLRRGRSELARNGNLLARLDVGSQPFVKRYTMLRTNLVFAVFMAMVIPVFAQDDKNSGTSESECADRFKASDVNNDNVLTVTELPKAEKLPPPLAKESLISRKEYLAACGKLPLAQGPQFDKSAPPSPHSTGQTVSPEYKGQQQPQGPTGPLETKSGGAPAESPQGQTPPGMQPAPDGSSKTIIDPDTKK